MLVRSRFSFIATALVAVVVASLAVVVPAGRAAAASYLNPRLTWTAQIPGKMLDVDATRVLYLDSSAAPPVLRIWDRSTNLVAATVPAVSGWNPISQYAFLAPGGVLFAASQTPDDSYNAHLFDWSGGATTNDVGAAYAPSIHVRAPFVCWTSGSTLYRRDLRSGRTITVSTAADSGSGSDLSADGDVVFSTNQQIARYRDGDTAVLGSGSGNYSPLTDGTNVAYRTIASSGYGVVLNDGTRDVLTVDPAKGEFFGGWYALAGGWFAYGTSSRAEGQQFWRRAPNGTVEQLGPIGGDVLLALSPSGAVTYVHDGKLLLDQPNRPLVVLASSVDTTSSQITHDHRLGRTWYLGDRLTLDLDGYLYTLNDPAPVHLTVTVTGHGTVTFSPYDQACRGTCTYGYSPGALLSLHTVADLPGWRFSGWGGACTGTDACVFRLDVDTALSADFVAADTTAPTVSAPAVQPVVGSQLSDGTPAAVPLDVSWTASDPDDGVAASDLEMAVNGGGFAAVPLPSSAATGARFSAAVGATYLVRARGTDQHGNVGDWVEGPVSHRQRQPTELPGVTVLAQQETAATLTGTWTTGRAPESWGESTITTRAGGSTASFTVEGEYVGIVCATGPGRGTADVYLDDHPRGSFSTAGVLTRSRRVLAVVVLPVYGTHTIQIRSTSADPLELDGIVVLR